MHCLSCRGPLEYVQEVAYARCTHCLSLFKVHSPPMRPRTIEPMHVAAADSERVATELGFAPRKGNYSVVGVGGVHVKLNTGKLERDLKTKISSYLWGLVFGAILLVLLAGIFVVVIVGVMRGRGETAAHTDKAPKELAWDGKAPLSCGAADRLRVSKVSAQIGSGAAVRASGNCELELVDVTLVAPVGVDASANAKVTVRGGSVTGQTHALVASANATIDVQGATIKGPTRNSGNAKLLGVR